MTRRRLKRMLLGMGLRMVRVNELFPLKQCLRVNELHSLNNGIDHVLPLSVKARRYREALGAT